MAATLLNEDLTQSLVGSPEASEAFVYLTGFFSDELTPSIAIQQSNPVADSLFPAGQVAMLPGGSFRAGTYGPPRRTSMSRHCHRARSAPP